MATAQHLAGTYSTRNKSWLELDPEASQARRLSIESDMIPRKSSKIRDSGYIRGRKNSFGSVSSFGSRFNPGGNHNANTDMTRMVATDDYMSDVNVRSMRRLMNVVYVMSRLMRAFHIDFNYSHLATWVHITEQWPYRVSWIIFYVEAAAEHHFDVEDSKSLWEIYTKIKSSLPNQRNHDPLLEIDRDEKKLESVLAVKQRVMTVKELKIFIPFSINLDPYLKKVIRDEYASRESSGDKDWFKTEQTSKEPLTKREAAVRQKLNMKTAAAIHPEAGKYLSSPIRLPQDILHKSLSKKTVEEVCNLMRQIDGMSACIDTYCDAIVSQNISGSVLARCNVQELKCVLNMNFGDWETFQWTLLSLRELEKQQKMMSLNQTYELSMLEANDSEGKALDAKDTKYADNAIYMEDALISGLLSTLNEDAHEDVVIEELMEKRSRRQQSECESIHAETESDVIYLTKSRCGGAMSQSIGSEDAFNALEKGHNKGSIASTINDASKTEYRQKKLIHRLDSLTAQDQLYEAEPYAWISSQTAPASPIVGRSRSSSVMPNNDDEHSAKPSFTDAPAISVERLGDKVRKTIKHALHKMDQPNTLPPVHRAREKSESTESRRFKSLRVKGSKSQGASREDTSIQGSIELPIFGDVDDDLETSKDNISSSPEQETVMPRDSARPRVQNLFQDVNQNE